MLVAPGITVWPAIVPALFARIGEAVRSSPAELQHIIASGGAVETACSGSHWRALIGGWSPCPAGWLPVPGGTGSANGQWSEDERMNPPVRKCSSCVTAGVLDTYSGRWSLLQRGAELQWTGRGSGSS
ncbi:hypothetical protein OBBRIDRAFT_825610 [Obba rivulosa]|uniref:Uncharacterized protein n=1 Tax=Obba rivulosa TaxID=1052685 RepID=A0A8E2DMF3_9APHY|nr:hypothetical protein OBBRIDRAFT_825610 [Obba rivulosa]